MKDIKVNATGFIDKVNLLTSKDPDVFINHMRQELAHKLAQTIMDDKRFFKETQTKEHIQIQTQCYVLSVDDFMELVQEIRNQERRFNPMSSIGGVY